jgi:hypothetical protein
MRNKRAKEINRQAREISKNFPVVTTQSLAFEYVNGMRRPYKVVEVVSNHVRRIRRAVDKDGMEGLHMYLETIYKLQKQRNEELTKETSDSK